uniref:Mitogen-activated protein kinase n=1 Tax=Rhizochromulina marina TaxID=1034831 RepID=A0A7S2WW08_9STRA|mmetsp:Transcript_7103/g.20554  ORF Transcript_7103/g.20554 Transcript_7103/m.20554 type:complete len:446 (+) Transcript_7103:112-1449(+)
MAEFNAGEAAHQDVHTIRVSNVAFVVPRKYSLIRPIGQGAYGVVISATDGSTGRKVAIKKIHNVFRDAVDAKRILREITLLRKFNHENIIRILDLLPPTDSVEKWEDLYIVTELMETDLHRIIYSKQALSLDHVQYFVYQILRALKYMHSADVVHRDLKPSNILLNANCDLKICDLGLARGIELNTELTEYVVTRWYRAPEIMLACQDYSREIDVWSVGCILSELLERQPVFPGEDYIDQLRRIVARLGSPTEEELEFVIASKARKFLRGLPPAPRRPFTELYPSASPSAADLLQKLLTFSPRHRVEVETALEHPFLDSLHDEEDEPSADFAFDFPIEGETLSRDKVRELIWNEVARYHPDEVHKHRSAKRGRLSPNSQERPHSRPATKDPRSAEDDEDERGLLAHEHLSTGPAPPRRSEHTPDPESLTATADKMVSPIRSSRST